MFKGRSRGLGRGRGVVGTVQKVPLKGLFSDGIWQCNCAPRLPAQRFQTKNGGKNHGRWFYTCQHAQPKRCDFFLWDDDAKPREASAVLSNSRTEPLPTPQTPTKPSHTSSTYGLQTPDTSAVKSHRSVTFSTPQTPSKHTSVPRIAEDTQDTSTTLSASEEEFYDWPASDDEDVFKAADEASSIKTMPPPETPRKAAKIDLFSSPGKRRFSLMEDASSDAGGDVFVTPNTGVKRDELPTPGQTISSAADTPTPRRFKDMPQAGQESELALEMLKILRDSKILITPDTKAEIQSVCEKHTLSTHGILKGRDISRAMVNTKNAKISELQGTIAALQAERETNRAVIRHLRRDMETAKPLQN